jgi:RNA polymerase sigma-70 factor, ECF subfamily
MGDAAFGGSANGPGDRRRALVDLYDEAMPEVYGYLVTRCGSAPVAEDLTAETFMAAVRAVKEDKVPSLTVAWLIGVARHKLVDHWRAESRHERKLALIDDDDSYSEPWDVRLDALQAQEVLRELAPHHRSALTLRYLDDLPVPVVADHLGRTVHATEALLVRARTAFRRRYRQHDDHEEVER